MKSAKHLVLLGLLTAILIVFSFTPIGSIPVGPLVITLNIIPVAIAAVAMGPAGGAAMGAVFGLLSFLQCLGIGVPSGMGAVLFGINPFLAFIQRFIPRVLDGLLVGFIFRWCDKGLGHGPASFIAGFCSAFLNTLFFMGFIVLFFYQTEFVQNMAANKGAMNPLMFVVLVVGVQGLIEWATGLVVGGAVAKGVAHALKRDLPAPKQTAEPAAEEPKGE